MRAVADFLSAVADVLKTAGEALAAMSPKTTLQTRIAHLLRNSVDYAS